MISELNNWRLLKKATEENSVKTIPLQFARCQVSIISQRVLSEAWTSSLNYVTDGTPFELCIGKVNTPFNIIIDHCLLGMKVGEACQLLLKADGSKFEDLADDKNPEVIQELCEVMFTQNNATHTEGNTEAVMIPILVTLLSITEQGKEIFLLSSEEKLAIAKELKENGCNLYKDQLDFSFMLFSQALKYAVCADDSTDTAIEEDVRLIKMQCYLNLAACQLKKGAYAFVVHNCTKALNLDPCSVKGLHRRAQAYEKIGDFESARADLVKALEQKPNNKPLQSLLRDVLQKCHEQQQSLATAMSKMFH